MKNKVIVTVGAVVFATASAFATQNQTPPAGQTPDRSGRANATDPPVTVSGCVERVGSGSTATYKLTKLERAGTMSTNMGTNRSTGASTQSPNASTARGSASSSNDRATELPREFALRPVASVDLSPHVDHKVEVTGTYDRQLASKPASDLTAGTAGTGPSRTSPDSGTAGSAQSTGSKAPLEGPGGTNAANQSPIFSVTSLKMVAAKCD